MKIAPKLLLASSAAVVALAATPALALTTFTQNWDGVDFGSGPGYSIQQTYEGWTNTTVPTGNSGIEIQYNNVAGAAHSGENLIELDSNVNSVMTYDTGLDKGYYNLSFYYSDRPGVAAASNGIEVLRNGVSIFTVPGGQGAGGTDWLLKSFNFHANAGDKLSFAAIGTSDSLGGYIDTVALAAGVPEPTTWAMMILGIGFAGAAMRRRQTVSLKYA